MGGLTVQRFSSLLSWWEAWQHPGRHGSGEGTKSSTSWSKGRQENTGSQASTRVSRSTPTAEHFLQGHTYSNKVTPNSATPWAKHIQTTTATLAFWLILLDSDHQTSFTSLVWFPLLWQTAWPKATWRKGRFGLLQVIVYHEGKLKHAKHIWPLMTYQFLKQYLPPQEGYKHQSCWCKPLIPALGGKGWCVSESLRPARFFYTK